mgnify:CR=1 FL=1
MKKLALNQANMRMEEEAVQSWLEKNGYKRPLLVQYSEWLGNAVTGDFGESYVFKNRDVSELLIPKLIVSAKLNIISFIIAISIGTPLGFYAAVNYGSSKDPIVVIISLVFYAMPVFFTAPLLILVFALQLDLVPAAGWGGVFDKRIILPALTIGVPGAAVFVRLIRSSMLEVLDSEFVKLARAIGVGWNKVIYKHALKNALITPLTSALLLFSGWLNGALVIEIIFGWPGIGYDALFTAVNDNDFPLLQGTVFFFVIIFVIFALLADLLYTIIDPRVRLTGGEK